MESVRAKAKRLLREIIMEVAPRSFFDLDGNVDALIDTIIEAAVAEAARRIVSKLSTGA